MVEEWRAIAGADGRYEVSNLGRVRSRVKGRPWRILKPKLPDDPGAYMAVSIFVGKKRSRRRVHSLVADAFLGPRPSPAHEVRHLDGDRANCASTNLAWGTRKQNAEDRDRHGRSARGKTHGMYGRPLHGEANGNAALTAEKVRAIRKLAATGMTQRGLARSFLINQAVVWRIIHRKAWVHVE